MNGWSRSVRRHRVGLKDIFGDHGLVGLVILKKVSNEFYFLDNLMISCRVFGRYLESWILKTIIDILKSKQCKYLLTEFVKTPKNQIALDFLKKNNFKLFPVKQLKKFRLKINKNIFKTKNAYIFDVLDGKIPNLEVFK